MPSNFQIPRLDQPLVDDKGMISRAWYTFLANVLSNGTVISSVSGLNTDNSDPLNPVIKISVDGTTVTGQGTPDSPLEAISNGGAVWGQITGTLSDQTDLQAALSAAPVLTGYTIAALPAGVGAGTIAYVTDANAPTLGGALVNGGSARVIALYTGTNWVAS